MNRGCRFLVLAAWVGVTAPTARADLIEFTFSGVISSVQPLSGPLSSIASGQAFTFTYLFDSTSPDMNGSNSFGQYALTSFSFEVGSDFLFGTKGHIDVNVPDSVYGVTSESGDYSVILDVLTTNPITTDLLPTTLDFDAGTIDIHPTMGGEVGGGAAIGDITSFGSRIVPLPAAVWLGAVGLGLVACIGRRLR